MVTASPGPASTLVLPGSRFRQLRQRWESREYEEVHRLHKALERDSLTDEEQLTLAASKTKLNTELEQVMSEISDMVGVGDYLAARDRLRGMRDDFEGLAVADTAIEELDRFRSDSTIIKEIRAAEELARVLARYPSRIGRERAPLIRRLETFLANRRYRNTKASAEAESLLAQWK